MSPQGAAATAPCFSQSHVLKKTVIQIKNQYLPPGYKMIPVRTVYLEMTRPPLTKQPKPPPGCIVRRWRRPPLRSYRSLFAAVGGKWGWSGRLIMSDLELRKTIQAETTEVFKLKWNSETAGFVELDRRGPGGTEITYFGLLPEFIGRGLGKFLLDWTIHRTWRARPSLLWLHTCEHDHPGAMFVYLKAGFQVFDEKVEMHPYPEDFLRKSKPAGG